jgi:hypothetical protein
VRKDIGEGLGERGDLFQKGRNDGNDELQELDEERVGMGDGECAVKGGGD